MATIKKTLISAVAVLVCLVLSSTLLGCSASDPLDNNVIRVGASPTPHAQILEQVKDDLAARGYTLEIVEYNDYVQPNQALAAGDLDANYFQHITYLNDYNAQNGTDLVNADSIHFEPFGLYAGKTTSLDELEDGAIIAVPNDTTNEARALLLLQQEGLITLKQDAGLRATVMDIEDNPHNFEIKEVEAAQLPRLLPDVDIAAINGNFALGAGLSPQDALASESETGKAAHAYANVVAVRDGDQDSDKIDALCDALKSQEVVDYINNTYHGAVVVL